MSELKVLVTGGSGMLGADVCRVLLEQKIDHCCVGRADGDLTDSDYVRSICTQYMPTHIINCAAYTAVDAAETDREQCQMVNVEVVKNLVTACAVHSTRLIQLSTDYVFSGDQDQYDEAGERRPINYYGQTKADAEELVENELDDYIIVRTSWLFGRNGKNFVDTICQLVSKKDSIQVVDDQVGCPTYTVDLAQTLVGLLSEPVGVYHVTNAGSCSWYDFAVAIRTIAGGTCVVESCTSDQYPTVASRPGRSVLHNSKLPSLRHWREALADYLVSS